MTQAASLSDVPETRRLLALVGVVSLDQHFGAVEAFFEGISPDVRVAFVVQCGSSPEARAARAQQLQLSTRLQVVDAHRDVPLVSGRIYLIAEDTTLLVDGDLLRLRTAGQRRRSGGGMEAFVRSLCADVQRSPLCVLLSPGSASIVESVAAAGGALLTLPPESLDSSRRDELYAALCQTAVVAATQQTSVSSTDPEACTERELSPFSAFEPPLSRPLSSSDLLPLTPRAPRSGVVSTAERAKYLDADAARQSDMQARLLCLEAENRDLRRQRGQLEELAAQLYSANADYQRHINELDTLYRDYRRAIESLSTGIVFLGPTGALLRHNFSALGFFDIRGDSLGRPLHEVPTYVAYPLLKADIQQALNLGEVVRTCVGCAGHGELYELTYVPSVNQKEQVASVILFIRAIPGTDPLLS